MILTNDPSFTAWGWVVIDWNGMIKAGGCIKTQPEHKKRHIYKADDTRRRISEINYELKRIIREYHINYLLSESVHGSQNANAAVMIGAVTGITQTISDCLEIPLECYTERDAKKCLLGKVAATKLETIEAIDNEYSVPIWTRIKYQDEAMADALAIYHVAKHKSQTIQMMMRRYLRLRRI